MKSQGMVCDLKNRIEDQNVACDASLSFLFSLEVELNKMSDFMGFVS